ncbi:MAG: ATP-grasp domain-containing protein [Candidatus Binatia bacterium]
MNLLVTNTRNAQAYALIRALRPHSNKIVATMEGDNRLAAWFSHAARSRLVDRRYFTPSPAADWRAGKIQKENTEKEENYVQAVLRICEEEKIDTIFPSFDPHVYVLSKNKERFKRLGILIPIPDYETVPTPLDKYRTIQAAQDVGFPCPKTFLAESDDDLKRISEMLGFPLVVKPRFTAGGRGTKMVRNLPELLVEARTGSSPNSRMIQEYIPGNQENLVAVLLDTEGVLKLAFSPKRIRNLHRLHQHIGTALESFGSHAYTMQAAKLGQKIGWWGTMVVQVKIDSRDGVPKLMEINPRMGNGLWYRVAVGINEPLMCIKIAKGEEVEAVKDYPAGTLFIHPVEDLLGLGVKLADLVVYKFRINLQGRKPIDPLNPPPGVKELMRSYKETYFNRKNKVYDFYFASSFSDPLVSIVWWLQTLPALWRVTKELGK